MTAIYDFIGRDTPPITTPGQITTLPELDATFVALLAISAGSYVGTKLITRSGEPPLSLAYRDQRVREVLYQERANGKVVDGRQLRSLMRPSGTEQAAGGDAPRTSGVEVGGIALDGDQSARSAAVRRSAGVGVPLDKSF
jgi:hypothetical protein